MPSQYPSGKRKGENKKEDEDDHDSKDARITRHRQMLEKLRKDDSESNAGTLGLAAAMFPSYGFTGRQEK